MISSKPTKNKPATAPDSLALLARLLARQAAREAFSDNSSAKTSAMPSDTSKE